MNPSKVVTSLVFPKGVEVFAATTAVLGSRSLHRRILASDNWEPGESFNGGIHDDPVDRSRGGFQLGQTERVRASDGGGPQAFFTRRLLQTT